MNEHWLRTNEKEDLVASLAMLNLALGQVEMEVTAWKWAVIITHSALQSAMACHLGSLGNNFLVSKNEEKAAKVWIETQKNKEKYQEMMMDSFLNLYNKLKKHEIEGFKFTSQGTQDQSIEAINIYRNNFVHFMPIGWSVDVSDFPDICKDCLDIINKIDEHTWHWRLYDDQPSSFSTLLDSCLEKLKRLKLEYGT